MTEGYCVRERKVVQFKDPQQAIMRNGRPAIIGSCPDCNTRMFKMGKLPSMKKLQHEYEDEVRESVFADIRAERARQDQMCENENNRKNGWRKFNEVGSTPLYKLSILMEETGEVGTALLKQDTRNLEQELVQVAAVATAWVEALRQ